MPFLQSKIIFLLLNQEKLQYHSEVVKSEEQNFELRMGFKFWIHYLSDTTSVTSGLTMLNHNFFLYKYIEWYPLQTCYEIHKNYLYSFSKMPKKKKKRKKQQQKKIFGK